MRPSRRAPDADASARSIRPRRERRTPAEPPRDAARPPRNSVEPVDTAAKASRAADPAPRSARRAISRPRRERRVNDSIVGRRMYSASSVAATSSDGESKSTERRSASERKCWREPRTSAKTPSFFRSRAKSSKLYWLEDGSCSSIACERLAVAASSVDPVPSTYRQPASEAASGVARCIRKSSRCFVRRRARLSKCGVRHPVSRAASPNPDHSRGSLG